MIAHATIHVKRHGSVTHGVKRAKGFAKAATSEPERVTGVASAGGVPLTVSALLGGREDCTSGNGAITAD